MSRIESVIHHKWPRDISALFSRADVVFADPPYNLGVKYEDDATGDKLPKGDYLQFLTETVLASKRLLTSNGTFWLLCPENWADDVGPMLTALIGPRLHRVIMEEGFSQYQQKSLTKDYRMLFCHTLPGAEPYFDGDSIREKSVRQEMGDSRADPRGRVPGCVWKIRRLQGTAKDRVSWHPAQLAPELLERIIKGWCPLGGHVVDLVGGSGNMIKAARKSGVSVTLFESSQTYVQKIREEYGCQ